MSSPEDLLTACATSQEERQRLISRANRPIARKAALEWLNSAKVIDTLLLWPEVDSNNAGMTTGVINLLASVVSDWSEEERPSFAGLCTALENRLARSGGMEALVPQNSSAQEHGREPAHPDSPQLSAVKSGRDLLDQAKLLSRWLSEQPQGWLASHRLIKTVRWDTVDQIPPLDSSGRTRLVPPRTHEISRINTRQKIVNCLF